MLQVQAFIKGNSVANKVNAALEVNGTPNLLLQVCLCAAVHPSASRVRTKGHALTERSHAISWLNACAAAFAQEAVQYVPAGTITPPTLGPVVAFQDQTSIVQTQTITLSNVGNTSYTFNVSKLIQPSTHCELPAC